MPTRATCSHFPFYLKVISSFAEPQGSDAHRSPSPKPPAPRKSPPRARRPHIQVPAGPTGVLPHSDTGVRADACTSSGQRTPPRDGPRLWFSASARPSTSGPLAHDVPLTCPQGTLALWGHCRRWTVLPPSPAPGLPAQHPRSQSARSAPGLHVRPLCHEHPLSVFRSGPQRAQAGVCLSLGPASFLAAGQTSAGDEPESWPFKSMSRARADGPGVRRKPMRHVRAWA